jgi:hypothetical protein
MRSRSPQGTSVVTGCLTAFGLALIVLGWNNATATVSAVSDGSAFAQPDASCPLTMAQQKASVAAWQKLIPVFRHPRCINCHGAMPKALPERILVGNKWEDGPPVRHAGIVDMDSNDSNITCEECHIEGWGHALNAPNWTDKTNTDICRGMHIEFDESAPRFIDHIVRDSGNTPFIGQGFIGKRGLVDGGLTIYETETGKKIVAAPPPGTHAQLIQLARAWVAAQGGKFVGDKDCGCEIAEYGELYSLDIEYTDDRGFPGIVVTDKVSMKIRIVDGTVTVSEIINFASKGVPDTIKSGDVTVVWVPDPIGDVNVVSATGELSVDYPVPGTRTLLVHLTQAGTHAPAFQRIMRTLRQDFGGDANGGFPGSATFGLIAGKKEYDNGAAPNLQLTTKLTLLASGKLPKPGR